MKDEYCRTVACALAFWTPWHDAVPGCAYSEEPNEAALSRLGRMARKVAQAQGEQS